MAKDRQVSAWSVNIRATDTGYQARVFEGGNALGEPARPKYYHASTLEGMFHLLRGIIPDLPKEMLTLRKEG